LLTLQKELKRFYFQNIINMKVKDEIG